MKKLLFALASLLAVTAQAQDFASFTLASTKETPHYVLGSRQERWTGGQVSWYYNPANQPAYLSTADVINAIKTASERWMGMCSLNFTYMGITTLTPNVRSTASTVDRVNVFGWGQLTDEMAQYSAYALWWRDGRGAIFDADVVINTSDSWSLHDVEAVMTHELGHVIGLDHSDVPASVMFADPYNSYEFQRTLRGDDASACAALYSASANAESNRALNWAEQTYQQLLAPHPAASGTIDGYYYRYYSATDTYVGTKNGNAYLMGANKVIQDLGKLNNFSDLVRRAGF